MESDRSAADQILEQAAWARRVARAMVRDEHLAEDLAQDALEAGLRRQGLLRRGIRAWLMGALRNLRRQAARKEEHLRARELRAVSAAPQASPDELLEIVEAQRAVSAAVIDLPEATRSALILRYYEQLPVREVALRLRVSEKAAELRIQRGLQQLRDILKSRHGTSWIAAVAPLLEPALVCAKVTITMTIKTKSLVAAACALMLIGVFAARSGFWSGSADASAGPSAAVAAAASDGMDEVLLRQVTAHLPSSDPAPDLTRTPARTELTLRVLDASGAPVPGARFVVFRSGPAEALASGATDEHGVAAIPAGEEARSVVLAASGHAPWWGALPGGDSPEIRLPPGKRVSGIVHVNGRPATRELPLELRSDLRLIPRGAVPEPVLALVGIHPQATGTFAGASDGSGCFSFSGLPERWEGAVRCTDLLFMGPGQASNSYFPHWTPIPAPHHDFILELRESPAVRGLVVQHDGLTPAFPGWVTTAIHVAPYGRALNVAELKPDGSFEVVMRPWTHGGTQVRLEVKVSTPACAERAWNFEPLPANLAVGTLVLPESRTLRLQVRDESGHPFSGATAGTPLFRDAGRADADGRLTIELAAEDATVDVSAEGYLTERIAFPDGREPLEAEVVMRPAADLRLHVRTPEGTPIAGATITILTDRDARDLPAWQDERFGGIISGRPLSSGEGEGRQEWRIETEAAGDVVLRYLRPGRIAQVRVSLPGSAEIQEADLGPIPESGHLDYTFTMASGRRTFTGRIISPEGRAIRPLALELVAEAGSGTTSLAAPVPDEEGVFQADLAHEGAFFVVIEAEGFASLRREVTDFDPESGPMTFRLGLGRSLAIRVLDEAGNPLPGVAEVKPENRRSLTSKLTEGACVIANVPPEDLLVVAVIGGRLYEKVVPAADSAVDFILPVQGGIGLALNEGLRTAAAERHLRLILAPLEGGKQIEYWFQLPEQSFPVVPAGEYWAMLAATTTGFDLETLADWKLMVVKPGEVTELAF